MASNTYITVDDIRLYILDRSIEDNPLDKDLSFSDEEILAAMERAARAYNGFPPYVDAVTPDCLPKHDNTFFDAVVQQLYIGEIARISRNDIDYEAGGVSTNLETKRIAHLRRMAAEHGELWRESARQRKVFKNWRDAFGSLG